jgi:DNA helicase-2/ATP-dependent DNA helicase PcrA
MNPDQQQLKVLASSARFNIVFGNAGAAKTTTLAMKAMDALQRGTRPNEILCLTYSDAAVLAFQQRLRWLGLPRDDVPVTTFARLCHKQLLDLEGPCDYLPQPNRRVYDTVLAAIAGARLWAEDRGFREAFEIAGEGTLVIPNLLHAFRRLKGTLAVQSLSSEFMLTPGSACEAGLDFTQVAVLQSYEYLRRAASHAAHEPRDSIAPHFRLEDDPFFDMASVLTAVDPIFTADAHPMKLGVRMLFVDEGHDVNLAMFTVLQHVVEVNPIEQMFVVGDVDQVVHSDSGADPSFMKDAFTRGIGAAQELTLPLCRRFGENLARPLSIHAGKSYAHLADNETRVEVYRAATPKAAAALIEGVHSEEQSAAGGRVPSLAVLLRHPWASVRLENELALRGFSFETHGFMQYLARPEVHFLRVLVAWATGALDTLSNVDLVAVQAALGEFTGFMRDPEARDIQYKALGPFKEHCLGDLVGFIGQGASRRDGRPLLYRSDQAAINALRRFLSPFMADVAPAGLPRLVEDAGFRLLAKRAFVFDERVDEAMSAMMEFAGSAATFSSFGDWLQQMADRDFAMKSRRRENRRLLHLYSVPEAKGLEFEHVVIPDVDAGVFDWTSQEERNLFYVATSRARKRLTMTFRSRPSSFLSLFGRESDWDAVSMPDLPN